MIEFLSVVMITILAVISPGADFAMVTKNSYLYGRLIGILTATGIATGVWLHVTYTLVTVLFIENYTPKILSIIQYAGAIYLIYIGYQTFKQKVIHDAQANHHPSAWQAFKTGFLTNALNPKTTLFVMSTFTQIIHTRNSLFILFSYGALMSLTHLIWFIVVARVFSNITLRNKMLNHQVLVNQIIGSILMILGILLLFTHLH
ncbi:MAG: LysE family translocator [Acinetobacter sp.]